MTGSKSQLLQNGSSIVSVKGESSGKNTLRFSGRMNKIITCDELSDQFVTQVSVAARENEAIVVLQYSDITRDTWKVTPQSPLLVTSRREKDLSLVTIYPAKDGSFLPAQDYNEAIVEVLIETGTTSLEVEEGPFLILNASQGVELDKFKGSVESWEDIRPTSGAPGKWVDITEGTELDPSNPIFKNEPSVQGNALVYQGSFSRFDFMNGSSPFTIMVTYAPTESPFDNTFFALPGGLTHRVEGGFRPSISFSSNFTTSQWQNTANTVASEGDGLSGDGSGELFQSEELIEKPTVIIYDYSVEGGTGTMRVYYQGRWQELAATMPASGGSVSGSPALFVGEDTVDYRIYDRSATSEEISEYISQIAVAKYGVDDTEQTGSNLVTGSDLYFRFNREVEISTSTATEGSVNRVFEPRIERTYSSWTSTPAILGNYDSIATSTVDGLGIRTNIANNLASSAIKSNEVDLTKFDFLNGSGDMTLSMVFKVNTTKANYAGLFVMSAYDTPGNGGSNIYLKDGSVLVQTDNSDTSVRVNYESETDGKIPPIKTGRTYAIVYRVQDTDPTNSDGLFYVDLIDVSTGVVFSKIGTCDNPATGSALVAPTLAGLNGLPNSDYSVDVTYYELGISNNIDIDIEEYKKYVLARYT